MPVEEATNIVKWGNLCYPDTELLASNNKGREYPVCISFALFVHLDEAKRRF